MNRWTRTALLALALAGTAATAQITTERGAPIGVKPAILDISATPPLVKVDGKDERLSPGARIRDRNNRLMLSASIAGQRHYTVLKRDAAGMVHDVWLLDEAEYRKLGGTDADLNNPDGHKRFAELLDLVWAARALVLR